MPEEVKAYRSSDGELYSSWHEAAASEAARQFAAILPIDLQGREHVAAQMAMTMFVERAPAALTAFGNLYHLMQQEPKAMPALVVDNTRPPVGWLSGVLKAAGRPSE